MSASFFKIEKLVASLRTLRVLWGYLWNSDKKMRFRLICSVLFNLLGIIASICIPVIFSYIINSFSAHSFTTSEITWFLTLLVAYITVWFLSKIFVCLREIIIFPVMERGIRLLASKLFQHIQLLPFQHHLKRKTGETIGIIETAIQSFPPIVCSIAFALGPLILENLCGFMVISFICGISYSLILLMCLIFYVIITLWAFKRVLRPLRKANFSHLTANSKIVDSLLNFSSVKYFHTYNFEFQKIDDVLSHRERELTYSLIKDQMIRVYQIIILTVSFLLLMLYTGYNLIMNNLSLGEFIMIHTYMLQFAVPLEGFGQIFQTLNQSFVKMERALRVFKVPFEFKNKSIILDPNQPFHIVFDNVWFGYKKEAPILKGISFEILPNQTLAIIGETGSGKSTIVSLLLGFLEPWKGRILINGSDIKDINQESLIGLIGVVPQDVNLFNDTVAHNVLYANMSANKEMLMSAFTAASLKDTIEKFPQGFETIVGERGLQLSGGEKQRIGLARVILRHPKLYIFDEATSSLDLKTEKQIIKNIENISLNASTLIIAHRLSTVAFANQIILLDQGIIKNKDYNTLIKEANSLVT
ncbi:MAG: ATP-binding cassette domain-containing protein [Alphaproteobacteria bacterium]|nr:ATP-binding cassette domain-containing protein [Alphaproteobacteria bacterium]